MHFTQMGKGPRRIEGPLTIPLPLRHSSLRRRKNLVKADISAFMERAHVAAGGPFCFLRCIPKFLGRFYIDLSFTAPIFGVFKQFCPSPPQIKLNWISVGDRITGLFPCMRYPLSSKQQDTSTTLLSTKYVGSYFMLKDYNFLNWSIEHGF